MWWYPERTLPRTVLLLADAAVVLWLFVWASAAGAVRATILLLDDPAALLIDFGDRFRSLLGDVADTVEGVPLVGGTLRDPFERLGGTGALLADAGRTQQEVVGALGTWGFWLTFVVPTAAVVIPYVLLRVHRARAVGDAAAMRDAGDLATLALRAVATRPLRELRRVSSAPATDLAAGRVSDLAALQLRALGLRPPPLHPVER